MNKCTYNKFAEKGDAAMRSAQQEGERAIACGNKAARHRTFLETDRSIDQQPGILAENKSEEE